MANSVQVPHSQFTHSPGVSVFRSQWVLLVPARTFDPNFLFSSSNNSTIPQSSSVPSRPIWCLGKEPLGSPDAWGLGAGLLLRFPEWASGILP